MSELSTKKKWLGTWLGALPLVFSAGLALAAPIDGTNDRPVPITPPDFGPSMQQMLDSVFGAGTPTEPNLTVSGGAGDECVTGLVSVMP